MLRITLRNIRNLISYEGEDTLCIHLAGPPPQGDSATDPIPVDVCSDLEGLRRETSGVCPIHGSYVVYEEFYTDEGWIPIGMKQRGRWLWGKDNVRCRRGGRASHTSSAS